ncbi:MAG: 30S ribosomal protein S20 [Phycisphaerales bacterium]|nr:30S ribosomal protein S20 [Phycisphaerales bacterium]
MANSRSAKKRIRQNIKQRSRNRWRLRAMRQAMRSFNENLAAGKVEETREALHTCQKVIDRSAQKGVIHKNQAARRKSRMVARFKALQHG